MIYCSLSLPDLLFVDLSSCTFVSYANFLLDLVRPLLRLSAEGVLPGALFPISAAGFERDRRLLRRFSPYSCKASFFALPANSSFVGWAAACAATLAISASLFISKSTSLTNYFDSAMAASSWHAALWNFSTKSLVFAMIGSVVVPLEEVVYLS